MHVLIAVLQLLKFAAMVSRYAGLMLSVFVPRLQTSVNQMHDLPLGLVPVTRSPYREAFEILHLVIHCPHAVGRELDALATVNPVVVGAQSSNSLRIIPGFSVGGERFI